MRNRSSLFSFFFFNDTATTEIYTLSLHDALPIFAEDDGELVAVVGSGGRGCGVAGGGGSADRRAVLLPLVAQGCRARGRDREGRRLTDAHRLTRRLSRDRGSDQHGTHRESGGVAGHAARGVADDDRELVAVVGSGGGGGGVAGGGGAPGPPGR